MIFASSDVASLLHRWEVAEYVSEGFVIVGCAGELVADFFTRLPEKARKHIGSWSTIVLILALSVGLKCLIKTNELSGSVIGSLGDKAEEAGRKANTATTNSETALTKSGQALDEANGAEKTAGKAQNVAGTAASKAENLDRQLGATKTDLNTAKSQLADAETAEKKEEQTLINMAVCLAPRVIPTWSIGSLETSADPLRPMAGQKVFIDFVPDPEARRAAISLAGTLSEAKWDVQLPLHIKDGLEDGVSVQPSMAGMESPLGASTSAFFHASDVAEKLIGFLHSYNWEAKVGLPHDADRKLLTDPNVIPAGEIRVQIGLYPAITYVSPPGAKDLTEAVARYEQKQQEDEKKMKDEYLKTLTSQQAAAYRADSERWEAQKNSSIELYSDPCKPLSGLTPGIYP